MTVPRRDYIKKTLPENRILNAMKLTLRGEESEMR